MSKTKTFEETKRVSNSKGFLGIKIRRQDLSNKEWRRIIKKQAKSHIDLITYNLIK